MPYKKFEQICDRLLAYNKRPTQDNQTALVDTQDNLGWPWSASTLQLDEWNELCQRLDRKGAEGLEFVLPSAE